MRYKQAKLRFKKVKKDSSFIFGDGRAHAPTTWRGARAARATFMWTPPKEGNSPSRSKVGGWSGDGMWTGWGDDGTWTGRLLGVVEEAPVATNLKEVLASSRKPRQPEVSSALLRPTLQQSAVEPISHHTLVQRGSDLPPASSPSTPASWWWPFSSWPFSSAAAAATEAVSDADESVTPPPPSDLPGWAQTARLGSRALAKYMKAKVGGSIATVQLSGSTPGNHNLHCLGTYTKSSQKSAGRHVYQLDMGRDFTGREREGSLSLWFAEGGDDATGGRLPGSWYVGPTAMVGSPQGFLTVTENTNTPEEVRATWRVFFEGELHDAPALKVLTPEAYKLVVRASCAGSSRELAVTGALPESFGVFGFSKLTQALGGSGGVSDPGAEPIVVNDRYTYRSDDGEFCLWHVRAPPTWVIGSTDDVGSRAGFMVVEDAAPLPERITATWMVFDEGVWTAAPGIKIVADEGIKMLLAA